MARRTFLQGIARPFFFTLIKTQLSAPLPNVIVVSVEVSQHIPVDFLKEVADVLHFLKVRFSVEFLFSASQKAVTRTLIDMLFPVPLYRTRYGPGPGAHVFKRVRKT